MGKKKTESPQMPQAPTATNSKIYQDGFLTGETYQKNGETVNKSYSTPFQQQQLQASQQYIPEIQQRILNPSADQQNSWKAIADANKAEQMKGFNENYGKMRDNLVQNLSSRGLQKSSAVPYMTNEFAKTQADKLNTIENQTISEQQTAKNNDLNYNNTLLNMLSGNYNNQLQTSQTNLNNANTGFNAGNNFNLSNYGNQMDNWALQQQLNGSGNDLTSSLLGAGATVLSNPKVLSALGTGALKIGGFLGGLLSDERVKQNINKLGTIKDINIYDFEYKPEFIEKYNLPKGVQIGVMAQEVEKIIPDSVTENKDGYKKVDYNKVLAYLEDN